MTAAGTPALEAGFLGCFPGTALVRCLATGADIVAVEHCLLGIESMALVVGEAVGLGGERGQLECGCGTCPTITDPTWN